MRVLLTGLAIRSHLLPALVPVAKALQRAGHEVAIATGGAVAADLERLGIPALALPDVLSPEEVAATIPAKVLRSIRQWRPEVSGTLALPLVNDEMTAAFAANLLDAARTWRPDLIVRETNEYAGFLVADVLDVPLAVVDIAPLIVRLVPDLTDRLNVLRESLGLAAIDSLTPAYGQLTAGLLPEPWYSSVTPAHRFYRAPEPLSERLDPALTELPADAPLVLASFGSNLDMLLSAESELLPIAVKALGSLPVRAVVALGSDEAVAAWTGPRPENVHLAPFVQQRLLLSACNAFLTHAGFSGVREALSAGVPMVALPLFSDQPANAARVGELGLGVEVDAAGLTPDTLGAALKRVLDKPSYGLAARGFQRRILGLPTLDAFAADLEALV